MRVVMNGVTGRMGRSQHLVRSVLAIREAGGVDVPGVGRVVPEPILVGRSPERLRALAEPYGLAWSTELERCLDDESVELYFDAQTTERRAGAVELALDAGKAVYCEKPVAEGLESAMRLVRRAEEVGAVTGVVQDKLFLPGMRQLVGIVKSGALGRVLSLRGEFGYWVFDGRRREAQRPSWNYRREDGGGIILDMLSHWRYLLEGLVGRVEAVSCLGAIHLPERVDEAGSPYRATAEDAAYSTFLLEGGVVAQFNSSWTTRVFRDELLQLQVDGTDGSAVAGLQHCSVQFDSTTPVARWDPDVPDRTDYRAGWASVPVVAEKNAFRAQWEEVLAHVATGERLEADLREGAKGVQLAALAQLSWEEKRWVPVPDLET